MLRTCLCVLAGVYGLQLSSFAVASAYLALALLVCITIGWRARSLAAVLVGALFFELAVERQADDDLEAGLSGDSILVQLRIADFPRRADETSRFVALPIADPRLPARLRVSWHEPPVTIRPNDVWQLELRLKRPRGTRNPGGFDYEAWLFREGVGATAYVVSGTRNHLLSSSSGDSLLRLRLHVVDRVTGVLRDPEVAAIIVALGVGSRHLLTPSQWQRFNRTGTNHLMAISGLHIGLAAAAAYLLSTLLTSLLLRGVNHHLIAMVLSVPTATGYALLSGLAVPSQRAALMLGLLSFAVIRRRAPLPSQALALAALVVISIEPLSAQGPGFMLSFAAVALLCWLARRRPRDLRNSPVALRLLAWPLELLRLQCLLFMGLFGLVALLFGRVSFAAPLVNLVVVPIFSFITVPCVLLGMLFHGPLSWCGDALLLLAGQSVSLCNVLIDAVASRRTSALQLPALDGGLAVCLLLPVLWAWLPRSWPGRGVSMLAVIVVILHRPPQPPADCLDLTVLDVGQGLAAVVRSRDLTMIYDTGLQFRGGGSSVDTVILPFLNRHGIRGLDRLIVSHGDLDHAGGALDLLASIDVDDVQVGEAIPGLAATRCRAGDRWARGHLQMTTLHPPAGRVVHGNAASCVMLLTIGSRHLLLTGDIESDVERELLQDGSLLRADAVVVPHHGSSTSSSAAFVRALMPRLAIVPAGANNRWGFPHRDVVDRWRAVGAEVLSTAESGAVTLRLCKKGGIVAIRQQRSNALAATD